MKVFTMYDSVAKFYAKPIVVENRGTVIRALVHQLRDKNSDVDIVKHPEDFTLFEIGDWDERTGNFVPYKAHEKIGSMLDFLPESPSQALESELNERKRVKLV